MPAGFTCFAETIYRIEILYERLKSESDKTGKQGRVVHTLRFCSAKLLVGGRPPIPRNSSVPELPARFCETLYSGPLAHKVAQADGTVKGQDKQATPAHDRTTGLCNNSQEEKAAP